MSTATSRMRPARQRTSLSCANGGVWKCRPRKTPFAAEKEWLSCTKVMSGRPAFSQAAEVIDLGEKPARVAVLLRRHDLHRRNGRLFHLHPGTPVHPARLFPGAALLARSRRSRPPRIAIQGERQTLSPAAMATAWEHLRRAIAARPGRNGSCLARRSRQALAARRREGSRDRVCLCAQGR